MLPKRLPRFKNLPGVLRLFSPNPRLQTGFVLPIQKNLRMIVLSMPLSSPLQDIALQASATYIFASFRNAQLYRAMFNEYHDCDEAISLSKDVMESAASKFKEVIAKRRIPKAAVWKMLEKKQEFGAEYEKRIDEFNALCKQLNLKLSDSALVEVRL